MSHLATAVCVAASCAELYALKLCTATQPLESNTGRTPLSISTSHQPALGVHFGLARAAGAVSSRCGVGGPPRRRQKHRCGAAPLRTSRLGSWTWNVWVAGRGMGVVGMREADHQMGATSASNARAMDATGRRRRGAVRACVQLIGRNCTYIGASESAVRRG